MTYLKLWNATSFVSMVAILVPIAYYVSFPVHENISYISSELERFQDLPSAYEIEVVYLDNEICGEDTPVFKTKALEGLLQSSFRDTRTQAEVYQYPDVDLLTNFYYKKVVNMPSSEAYRMDAWLKAKHSKFSKLKRDYAKPHNYMFYVLPHKEAENIGLTLGNYRHAWIQVPCSMIQNQQQHAVIYETMTRQIVNLLDTMYIQNNNPLHDKDITVTNKYRLSFNLLVEWTKSPVVQWKIQSILDNLLYPLLEDLGEVASFTIDSQVNYYAELSSKIKHDESSISYFVTPDDLKNFYSINDFNTISYSSNNTREEHHLHLLYFIPAPMHVPLYVVNERGERQESFLLPNYGSVTILNRFYTTTENVVHVKDIMDAFGFTLSHLKYLIGIPTQHTHSTVDIRVLDNVQYRLNEWEVDVLYYRNAKVLLQKSLQTLQSLCRLTKSMPQMTVIERVAVRVHQSLHSIKAAYASQQPRDVLRHAKEAYEFSECAFYDPTLLPQLYFPTENLIAVYLPLLAPIALPLVMGFASELRLQYKKRFRKGKSTEKQD